MTNPNGLDLIYGGGTRTLADFTTRESLVAQPSASREQAQPTLDGALSQLRERRQALNDKYADRVFGRPPRPERAPGRGWIEWNDDEKGT